MRQVDEAELIWNVMLQLSRLPAATIKGLSSQIVAQQKEAQRFAAQCIVRGAIGRYEVLSGSPLPEGRDLFSRAAYGGAGGCAPTIDPPAES